jgi:aminoglycoside phosphotransferase (APT) family kinase protein
MRSRRPPGPNDADAATMHAGIDAMLVRRLVAEQFAHWAHLAVRPVEPSGWDNRTFRLGEQMLARLPNAPEYAAQVSKEQLWLQTLAPLLPLPIPQPLAIGTPALGYPWHWSVYRWIEGQQASRERIADRCELAASLTRFLNAMRCVDATGGPAAGPHNFHRGGPLWTYDEQTRQAISALTNRIDTSVAMQVWEQAMATSWQRAPVWVHGDVSAGNLLLREGRLSAVIDFGNLGVGDPACDLSIAWTLLDGESRDVFQNELGLDEGTWLRGRAWALWKAAILVAGLTASSASETAQAWRVLNEVLADRIR